MSQHRRLLVLGTGTGVGKTFASAALVRGLRARGLSVLALKPIESGVSGGQGGLEEASDAGRLGQASGFFAGHCYALPDPISPHLAARHAGTPIELDTVVAWVQAQEARATTWAHPPDLTLIETAGGALSPLSEAATNFDLACSLSGPGSVWILLAPDALGVLHDVSACLLALAGLGRSPDLLVLSQARTEDASTGSNAAELENGILGRLGTAAPRHRTVPTIERGALDCDAFVSATLALVER